MSIYVCKHSIRKHSNVDIRIYILCVYLVTHVLVVACLFKLHGVVCSCVIEPYNKHPNLLEVLLSLLKAEQVHSIRREVCDICAYLLLYMLFYILDNKSFRIIRGIGSIQA